MRLLGGFERSRFAVVDRRPLAADGFRAERLTLTAGGDPPIRAFLTGPEGRWRGLRAALYCHAHGGRYAIGASELIEGRPMLLPEPYGRALARRGIVALCVEMPCFGERQQPDESALSKAMLWEGRTLFGRMLADLAGAFDLLAAIEGVDDRRVGAVGFSMGATHAFWLGALEPRFERVAHACAFADLGGLVATGAHDLHGPYMTVPGLLGAFSTAEIAGLCFPRPQLAVMGALDPLTPEAATAAAVRGLKACYAGAPEKLSVHIEEGVGHQETAAMRAMILDFLAGGQAGTHERSPEA